VKRIEYKRNDKSLRKDFVRAGKLLQKFNTADYENDSLKTEILAELLGTSGSGISIERNFHCDLGYNIHVGDNFYAGFNCTILDMAEVRIGNHCLIGPNVGIYTAGHEINPIDRYKTGFAKPITIGNNVWIGGHVVINPGISIGENSVIGSGSVVTKDIPDNVIAAGNPCKVIRKLTDDDKQYDYKNIKPG